MNPSVTFPEPYDELRDSTGTLRPHFAAYYEHQQSIGVDTARANWTKAKQLLLENGATYNVYRDAEGSERPFRLSPIPMLLEPTDWQRLTSGIAQRGRLLGALLADLHGPARVLNDGDLPFELIYQNPRFLRPLHGLVPSRGNWLPLYAVDVIRAPNGRFYALEDSTQTPSGMGYALENRIVVAQSQPSLVRHCRIERLAGFFRLLRDRLVESALHDRDAPRIALWTPGPYSATYFEQVYLARYLGVTLVQGEDLAVRGDRVYLRTLGGLQPVDVLLRRVHDDFADPLELRPESTLGVPGMVHALRANGLAVTNPLGTGLVETPAILAYLPRLCRKLLGEELELESVPTYWCGDPEHLPQVLADFDAMVVKPTFVSGRADSKFVHQLSANERASLLAELRAHPERYVAQRFVPASRTPVIAGGRQTSRALVLRCYAQSSKHSDYQVLPGGLGLVAATDTDLAVSLTHGARSKDVWVLSGEALLEDPAAQLAPAPISISRSGGDLPSRIADNLFWLGRYAERAEAVARLCRVVGNILLDSTSNATASAPETLTQLYRVLLCQTRFSHPTEPSILEGVSAGTTCETDLLEAVTQERVGGSLVGALRSTLRVGRAVRDRLSYDTWRILSSLEEHVGRFEALSNREQLSQLPNALNQVIIALSGLSGLAMESMTRGFAFSFLDMGRRVERAISQVNLLGVTLIEPAVQEGSVLEAVLDVADSGMTYRRRYSGGLQAAPVLDLLLADESNPRSVLFQLKVLQKHVAELPTLNPSLNRPSLHRLLLSATSAIELIDVEELCRLDDSTNLRPRLRELIDRLARTFPTISDSLGETYLHHARIARHLHHSSSLGASKLRWERST